jgi:hypothetical protein
MGKERKMDTKITVHVPRPKRRAIEFYANGTPFRPKVVPNRRGAYRRQDNRKLTQADQ